MRASSAPFPIAPENAVHFLVPWQLRMPSGPTPLTDEVAAWDYQATLALSAVVQVDTDTVKEICHVGEGSRLRILVVASSSTTKIRGLVASAPVTTAPVHLDIELHGHELGGRLLLDTILAGDQMISADELSPHAKGSILWRHRKTTWLEGEGSRFPTETADFGSAPFFTPGALWFVDIRTDDLDAAALGSVRLVLNEAHPLVARLLAGDATAEVEAIMDFLRWDVARQLVLAALNSEEFIERDGRFGEETFGAMLAGVIEQNWPGESPRALRQVLHSDPGRLERELQDRAGLLRG